jgi:hypothetical protein
MESPLDTTKEKERGDDITYLNKAKLVLESELSDLKHRLEKIKTPPTQ